MQHALVADHADDRVPVGALRRRAVESDASADRRVAGEIRIDERLVHHHRHSLIGCPQVVEDLALDQGHPEGLKIARGDRAVPDLDTEIVGLGAFDAEVAAPTVAGER